MSFRQAQFRLATPADDSALQAMLRGNPMRGSVSLSLERSPSYFEAADVQGAEHRTIVGTDTSGRILCSGEASYRNRWLNGTVQRVGYLGALRLDARARSSGRLLRNGYRYFRDTERNAIASSTFFFTSIASDNIRARRFVERGLFGMPIYRPLASFTTYTLRAVGLRIDPSIGAATAHDLPDMIDRLAAACMSRQLMPAYDVDSIISRGLSLEDFVLLRRNGKIVAMAALWDQRSFKQAVIRGYSPPIRFARPMWNVLSPLTRAPILPPVGGVLRHAFVSHLASDSAEDLARLLPALLHRASHRQLDAICLGFAENDPLANAVQARTGAFRYSSQLYQVDWTPDRTDAPTLLDNFPVSPELALL